ncbi:alpha/beta hydrolase [Streptomyces sp. 1222.2]|uniref:alpha/beta hydrolase n=1 Tax=Streptomyces sp. 1222.2 TaxID=1938833 RepID=UPI0015CF2A0C|nr:alpha/beta hydrolase [Streptomyces sp. 1222.2]
MQAALRALSRSRFFSGLGLRALVFDVKQTRRYLLEPGLRQAARDRVSAAIGDDTRVVVAHSLGSVVAYETLCALDGHGVRALVTLGSPLGLRMVFDRLQPAPAPTGAWPGGDALAWTNLADQGDVVALVKDLRPLFGERVSGVVVHNGSHAHGSYDRTVRVWDLANGYLQTPVRRPPTLGRPVRQRAVRSDG